MSKDRRDEMQYDNKNHQCMTLLLYLIITGD